MMKLLVVCLLTTALASTVVAEDSPYPDMKRMCFHCDLGFCPSTRGGLVVTLPSMPEEECDKFREYIDSMVKFHDGKAYPHCGTDAVNLFSYLKGYSCWDTNYKVIVKSKDSRHD